MAGLPLPPPSIGRQSIPRRQGRNKGLRTGVQDAKAKPFPQGAIDDHARVSAIFPSEFARCWLTGSLMGPHFSRVNIQHGVRGRSVSHQAFFFAPLFFDFAFFLATLFFVAFFCPGEALVESDITNGGASDAEA